MEKYIRGTYTEWKNQQGLSDEHIIGNHEYEHEIDQLKKDEWIDPIGSKDDR